MKPTIVTALILCAAIFMLSACSPAENDAADTAGTSNETTEETNLLYYDENGRYAGPYDGDDGAALAASDIMNTGLAEGAFSGDSGTLYTIDLKSFISSFDSAEAYDVANFVCCAQGLLNRDAPTLFVYYFDCDNFWFRWLHYDSDKLLFGYANQEIDRLGLFIKQFGSFLTDHGMVLWDPDVPATLNAATTACGIDGYLPVRAGSALQDKLAEAGVEVKLDLTGKFTGEGVIWDTDIPSTGSAKCDVYLWAVKKYMARSSTEHMGYLLDGDAPYGDINSSFCTNRDYLVAEKCFVFDLSPWGDELPCDDPSQPLGCDLDAFKSILQAHYDLCGGTITQVHGFTPWHYKYTVYQSKGAHGEVESEWEHARILTAYNCVMDADAAGYCSMTNASIYRMYKLKNAYANNRPSEKLTAENGKVYVFIYMGDYDSAVWLTRFVPTLFTDDNRGSIPLNWAFNPNLSERAPMLFDYIYTFKTSNDYFITGDSGAGYLNPSLLIDRKGYSSNPDGSQQWIDYNEKYLSLFDMSVCGFAINGSFTSDKAVVSLYSKIFKTGSLYTNLYKDIASCDGVFHKNMNNWGLSSDSAEAASQIINSAPSDPNSPAFFAARTILFTPSTIKAIIDEVNSRSGDYVFCDAYTYFDLIAQAND